LEGRGEGTPLLGLKFLLEISVKSEKEHGSLEFGELSAYLGEEIQFKGEVNCAGALGVDGRLEGEIVRSEVLLVGEWGEVSARIEVGRLVVSGRCSVAMCRETLPRGNASNSWGRAA
jgi:cytoskeletal protein CcmA (bactofilin family)